MIIYVLSTFPLLVNSTIHYIFPLSGFFTAQYYTFKIIHVVTYITSLFFFILWYYVA
jgi:hypothetical protein